MYMYISNIGPQYCGITFHTVVPVPWYRYLVCETELEGHKKRSFLGVGVANKINKGQRPCLQQESLLQAPELRGLPRLDKLRREHFTLPLELLCALVYCRLSPSRVVVTNSP